MSSTDDGPTPFTRRAAGMVKRVASATGLHRALFYRYDYMFDPDQLMVIVDALTRTDHLAGPIVEVGCAAGSTTVFLDRHLATLDSTRSYVAIDTFAGFVDDDIEVERERGHADRYEQRFRNYAQTYFDQTMQNNGVTRVVSVRADANTYDFAAHAPISFCLIDVDLYRPVSNTLVRVIEHLDPQGIVVVDDCEPDATYDGAHQAYVEACDRLGEERVIVARKLGLLAPGRRDLGPSGFNGSPR